MNWVCRFGETEQPLGEESRTLLGGKGASLGALCRTKLPTPAGFTITTDACRRYFARGRRLPDQLVEQVRDALANLEQQTDQKFGAAPRPLVLAVRSGASVSMPGMMDSLLYCGLNEELLAQIRGAQPLWRGYAQFLSAWANSVCGEARKPPSSQNEHDEVDWPEVCRALREQLAAVCGAAPPEDPWEQLKRCIAVVFDSWHSPRAVAYRRARGLDHGAGTAVNVQTMFFSQMAGVLFTRNPHFRGASEGNRELITEEMLVEWVHGDGDQIVSGATTPQRLMICRESWKVVEAASDSTTTAVRIYNPDWKELAKMCMRVEQIFSETSNVAAGLDVEWGWSEGRFVLFQARPAPPPSSFSRQTIVSVEIARLRRVRVLTSPCREPPSMWVRHSLSETLPAPTPLTWDVIRLWMSGEGGFGRIYREVGYAPSARVARHGFLELVFGRVYADPELQAEWFGSCYGDGSPLGYDLQAIRGDAELLRGAPDHFDPEKITSSFLWRLPQLLWINQRVRWRIRRLSQDADRCFKQQVLPPFLEYVQQERARNLRQATLHELAVLFEVRRQRVLDEFASRLLLPGVLGAFAFGAVEQRLSEIMGPDEAGPLSRQLTTGLEGVAPGIESELLDQEAMLYDVAHQRVDLAAFLEHFGHRGDQEMDLAAPRWRETPPLVEKLAARLRASGAPDPRMLRSQAAMLRESAREGLPQRLAECGARTLLRSLDPLIETARRLLPFREIGKHYWMMGYELLRQTLTAMAPHVQNPSDVFFWRQEELRRFANSSSSTRDASPPEHEETENRRRRWIDLQRISVPAVMDTIDLEKMLEEPEGSEAIAGESKSCPASYWEATSLSGGVGRGRVVYADSSAAPHWPEHPLGPLAKSETGFVLICPSLDAGDVPLLLGAKGLIVEKGGALSHGAVIARQFGIPAVASPLATKQLSPGDLVEVDGHRGRIRVLSS